MTCPACRADLGAGQERCPACGTMVAPPVIGALAPDPARQTPPSHARVRDVPSARKSKGPAWKEEVRERIQRRRRTREQAGGELPLFDVRNEPVADAEDVSNPEPEARSDMELRPPETAGPALLGDDERSDAMAPAPRIELGGEPGEPDLPLRAEAQAEQTLPETIVHALPEEEGEAEDEWLPPVEPTLQRPVERPAAVGDRVEAALVDGGLLLLLDAVVVYFAGRAAQADLLAVLRHWPWLCAFLAFLGLSYAAWFTGTTGQTPGKMLVGLRVVETAGRPPSCQRAFLRAAIGALGGALLGLGMLPLFFDPARRALHDRLLRTRVVKF